MVVQETKSTIGEATAITAVCCAGLVAAANLVGAFVLVRSFLHDPGRLDDSLTLFATLGALVAAFAFGYGGVLLWRRDESGRWMLIVAAGVQVGLGVLGLLATLVNYDPEYGIHWFPAESVLRSIPVGLGGVPGAVTAIVNHSWAAALAALALGALVLLPAALPWTAAYTNDRQAPSTV
ncbi:hypothetical protein NN3_04220 [Nocardia neocaledoniensis NBRC 108232]|uniref:Uncharacterized protein n=1 Tax=Nocardia neocaledoniensis TaxID=236511 RepID=A0A317NRT8_9NOCA|nr:hypothetical protein [Nocardia neocaledoniensis]PWV76458.1 hypothetical protein DFR69_104566 [Nocardia neocaledoniensis]GEM29415.1 hypothetical protein NN3_04220 [Nocardia neocaledoniensis NBRC 108232]